MQVSSIMTAEPVAVTSESTLDDAQALMDKHGIRHLPVVDVDGHLLGVLSDRDLFEATGGLPARAHACRGGTHVDDVPRRVHQIARQPAIHVSPDDSAIQAGLRVVQHRIGCLPVVDQGRLVGIVSEMDMLDCFARGNVEADWHNPRVSECMTASPTTIHWYTSLGAAIETCQANGVRHLPVLESGELVGLVSDRDLRRAVGAGRHEEMPVDEVLTRELITVAPDDDLASAAAIMREHRFSCVPVLDNCMLVGILTSTDVLQHCLERAQS